MDYRQGEVWLARLSPSKGNESGKDRPVIIIQNNALNEINYPTCIIIPCSSVEMPETSIRPIIKEKFFDKKTFALLDQVRSIDVSKRLLRKIGDLNIENRKDLLNSFFKLLL